MDLSKLPRLSQTTEHQPTPHQPADEAPPPPHTIAARPPIDSSIGLAEAWISLGIGLLLLFVCPNTIQYLRSPAEFEKTVILTDEQQNPLSYGKSAFFWTDLGVTVFAIALILEGIALAAIRRPTPIRAAFAVTVAALIFNVAVIIYALQHAPFPLMCGVGVVVLGYMALTQWRLLQFLNLKRPPT